jgi:putative aldouronate transport system substrate-binding protein
MRDRRFSRRTFLQASAGVIWAGAIAACAPASPSGVSQPSGSGAATSGATTFTFTVGEDPRAPVVDQLLFAEWQKATGTKINWNPTPSSSVSERINLMLSTGEASDIFIGPRNVINQYAGEALLPLDDLIAAHAPNYSQMLADNADEVAALRAPDGNLYGMWGRRQQVYLGWLYRKDIADDLGFTSFETLDDWTEFLRAAKAADPNVHGIGNYGDVLGLARSLRGAFGIHGQLDEWMTMQDGILVDGALLPAAREAIDLVRSWYGEGLINPAMVARVEWEANKETWMSGKSILGINDYLSGLDIDAEYRQQNPDSGYDLAAAVPPVGPNGDQVETLNLVGWDSWGYALGLNNPNPEAAVAFLDYIFSAEGVELFWVGREGVTFEIVDGSYRFLPEVLEEVDKTVSEGGMEPPVALWKLYGLGFPFFTTLARPAPGAMMEAYKGLIVTEQVAEAERMTEPYQSEMISRPVFMPEEADELATLNADLRTYRDETWTRMIQGDLSMDDWDAYVAQMEQMGARRVEEIYNTAYQRTYGAE